MLALHQLGESEIEGTFHARPRAHRAAEARAPGLATVDGDDERPLAAQRVVALDVAAFQEDPVLDRNRMQVAGAGAEERERLVGRRLLGDRRNFALGDARPPEPDARGKELLLPGMRADCPTEDGIVLSLFEPVACRLVLRRPTMR